MGRENSELGEKTYFTLLNFVVLKKVNSFSFNLFLLKQDLTAIPLYFSCHCYHSSLLFIDSPFFLGLKSNPSLTSLSLGLPFSLPFDSVCCPSCCHPLMSNNSFLRHTLHPSLSQCRAARITLYLYFHLATFSWAQTCHSINCDNPVSSGEPLWLFFAFHSTSIPIQFISFCPNTLIVPYWTNNFGGLCQQLFLRMFY